jgi:hypothetical protein
MSYSQRAAQANGAAVDVNKWEEKSNRAPESKLEGADIQAGGQFAVG